MKKRLTLGMICVFMPLMLLMGFLVIQRSFTLSIQQECQRASLAQTLVMQNLQPQLSKLDYAQLTQAAGRYRHAYQDQNMELILCYRKVPLATLPNRYYDDLFTGIRCAMLDTRSRPETYAIAESITQDLTLLCLFNVGDVYAQRRDMLRSFAGYGLLFTGLVAGLSLLLAWLFTRPLSALDKAAQRLAAGGLADPLPAAPLPTGRKDELGALARSFAAMDTAVAQREEALRKEAESRQALLDALAHEMRTPLCAILGNTRLLQTAALDKAQEAALLEAIAKETLRLTDMDSQLMKLCGLPHESLTFRPVDIPALLADCARRLQPQAGEVRLTVALPQDRASTLEGDAASIGNAAPVSDTAPVGNAAPVSDMAPVGNAAPVCDTPLIGDEGLLALLLDNLAVNALRASKPGQTVTLAPLPYGFSITDHGLGMTEEQLSRAFEPFYKADKARTRQAGGAGLGLSLCQRIAKLHGGQLTLTSAPGQGTVATFIMPSSQEASAAPFPKGPSFTTSLQPDEYSVTSSAVSLSQEVTP